MKFLPFNSLRVTTCGSLNMILQALVKCTSDDLISLYFPTKDPNILVLLKDIEWLLLGLKQLSKRELVLLEESIMQARFYNEKNKWVSAYIQLIEKHLKLNLRGANLRNYLNFLYSFSLQKLIDLNICFSAYSAFMDVLLQLLDCSAKWGTSVIGCTEGGYPLAIPDYSSFVSELSYNNASLNEVDLHKSIVMVLDTLKQKVNLKSRFNYDIEELDILSADFRMFTYQGSIAGTLITDSKLFNKLFGSVRFLFLNMENEFYFNFIKQVFAIMIRNTDYLDASKELFVFHMFNNRLHIKDVVPNEGVFELMLIDLLKFKEELVYKILNNRKRHLSEDGIEILIGEGSPNAVYFHELKDCEGRDVVIFKIMLTENKYSMFATYYPESGVIRSVASEIFQVNRNVRLRCVSEIYETYLLYAYAELIATNKPKHIVKDSGNTKGFRVMNLSDFISVDKSIADNVRNLPIGYVASDEAKQLALKAGIKLDAGQTYVKSHVKTIKKKSK